MVTYKGSLFDDEETDKEKMKKEIEALWNHVIADDERILNLEIVIRQLKKILQDFEKVN